MSHPASIGGMREYPHLTTLPVANRLRLPALALRTGGGRRRVARALEQLADEVEAERSRELDQGRNVHRE